MFWEVTEIRRMAQEDKEGTEAEGAGRFVVHRHRDNQGPHFDLRLESGDCLVGWRIAGETLEPGCWATEKRPHPTAWLEQDQDALREQDGVYCWRQRDEDRCSLALTENDATTLVTLERRAGPPVEVIRALAGMAKAHNLSLSALPDLAEDGLTARSRAVERFCGLSRVLDGDGFDETGWRRLLAGMTLSEIGERLAKVETRHDRAHPPAPVSQPEPLNAGDTAARSRTAQAFRIAADE